MTISVCPIDLIMRSEKETQYRESLNNKLTLLIALWILDKLAMLAMFLIFRQEKEMQNNLKNHNYKGFVRSTSNIMTTTNSYQVNLPPHIWKKMKWKLNEPIRVIIDKENSCLKLMKDKNEEQMLELW